MSSVHRIDLLPVGHFTLCFIHLHRKMEEEERRRRRRRGRMVFTCKAAFVAVLMTSSRVAVVRGILFVFSDCFLKNSAHDSHMTTTCWSHDYHMICSPTAVWIAALRILSKASLFFISALRKILSIPTWREEEAGCLTGRIHCWTSAEIPAAAPSVAQRQYGQTAN